MYVALKKLKLKLNLLEGVIFYFLQGVYTEYYGWIRPLDSQTWTLRKVDIRRVSALEMWCWRKMEKISWAERITNDEVLRLVGERRQMVDTIVRRKKNWIGHSLRHECLLREVIEGKMVGKRPRGRPRIGMLNELIGDSYGDMKRRAENRQEWRCWTPRTCQ